MLLILYIVVICSLVCVIFVIKYHVIHTPLVEISV